MFKDHDKSEAVQLFSISDVCKQLGVQAHVLRYWESEFPMLAASKNQSGKRVYKRNDIEIAQRIKELLYEEQYTIAGAKKKLSAEITTLSATEFERITVLLAQTDIELRNLLAQYLARLDFNVEVAESGEEALVKSGIRIPNLAIIDLTWSESEAFQVIQSLADKDIPVIVLTAHDQLDDKVRAFSLGAADFVAKPFSPRELEARIDALLRRRGAKVRTGKAPVNSGKSVSESNSVLAEAQSFGDSHRRDPYKIVGSLVNGRYDLLQYAGGGGMGAVYRALDRKDNCFVAIKILKPDVALRDLEYIRLFQLEVKAARRLLHPNIVRVLDSGMHDDNAFMVMEWVNGKHLEDVINNEKLSIERIEVIFRQICEAIHYAHQEQVIHLDVKPANIFLVEENKEQDVVKVFDFGLSRIISKESGTTVTRFRGTHQYCAPEQFGGKVSFRSDVYSLGATLYYIISGVMPFSTTYINAKFHPNLQLPELSSLTNYRQLPLDVDRVISTALSKNPTERQSSAKALFEEFCLALRS